MSGTTLDIGQPKLYKGADGLPRCTRCDGDLCAYHKRQVRIAIGSLRTDTLMQGARDLRYLIQSRSDFGNDEP